MRYMMTETQALIDKEFHCIVKGIEKTFGVQVILTYAADYPPLYNHPEVTANVVRYLEQGVGDYFTAIHEGDMLSGS